MSLRWSEKELAAHLARRGREQSQGRGTGREPPSEHVGPPSGTPVANGHPRNFALGRLPVGKMNKTEAAYDAHLRALGHAGEILWHKFEGIKLRLADNTFFTVDFAVLTKRCELEMHEVKGFWQDDARVKIKVAASLYPFRFVAVKKKGKGWETETF